MNYLIKRLQRLSGANPVAYVKLLPEDWPEIAGIIEDALRYRFIRDLQCCSASISKNDGHATNYMSLRDWVAASKDWYEDVDPDELVKMIDSETDWCLHIYPNSPVGFNTYHGATLDAAIDAARTTTKEPACQISSS